MSARWPGDETFEQLLLLRRCYPRRSDYDRRPVLGVTAAIDYGEWQMRLARMRDVDWRAWRSGSAA